MISYRNRMIAFLTCFMLIATVLSGLAFYVLKTLGGSLDKISVEMRHDLEHDALIALRMDNAMAGHNAPTEITGEITLGTILKDLRSTPLVDPRREAPLPIPAASGGFGKLLEHPGNSDKHSTDIEGEKELILCSLKVSEEQDGSKAMEERLASKGHPLDGV